MRLNVSTRGLGISAGVRGARVSVGTRGTYVSFGRAGFRYRQKLTGPGARRRTTSKPTSPFPGRAPEPQTRPPLSQEAFITTASAKELAECSPNDTLLEAQLALARFSWFKLYAWMAGLGSLFMLASASSPVTFVCCILLGVGGVALYRWDRQRRTARLLYDVDAPEIVERLMMANGVGQWLSHTSRAWHIYYAEATTDWKRNAGASTLIQRTPTHSRPGSLERVELNIETWAVPVGPQRLLFLPDRLIVQQGTQLAGIPYDQLIVHVERTRFIEDGPVPPDSRTVDTTWQHVNRDGGPDRRFAQNRQLPVLEYGRLELLSPSGMRVVLQFSSPAAPEGAAKVLALLAERAAKPTAEPPPQQTTDTPGPDPNPTSVPNTSNDRHAQAEGTSAEGAEAFATLLRYLAAADRRISDDEIAYAKDVLTELYADRQADVARLISSFRTLRTDQQSVTSAINTLRTNDRLRARVTQALLGLARADGKVSPKEKERLDELTQALG